MGRIVLRAVEVLAVLAVLVYTGDFLQLKLRIPRGNAFGAVTVHQMLVTPLKGQKEEYDFVGDLPVTCTHSLFPQAQKEPCWWVARHTTVWE